MSLAPANAAADAATRVVPPGVADRIESLGGDIERLAAQQQELLSIIGLGGAPQQTWLEVLNGYLAVLVVAFLVTVLTIPLLRKLAVANGIVDRPDARKVHRMPIAYLGGVGVYLDLDADERPALAAIDRPDGAGSRRGDVDVGRVLVREQRRSGADYVAFLDS